ncbi:TraR/DksA C4-type zinc finger protein [Serpentinicella sp. ANB-PHB4]|uniref:TraR/DksA C4-type zinc finger protein n=1 Tax=Serpentinicella sp. ANB-PHB4 TaxID=3074076 RepID=UPI00285BEEEC|nr:TraR/DksA C4-type zinc finger protein [Serpentinicella sp. ANB-PHB4]MDR5657928.1 TraR/DksA C4-type zinc finger protein [Serpentinicella sp. ANB-PHB4]
MESNKLQYFKRRLQNEKNEILETLKSMEDRQPNSASMREYTEELSAYDNHPADLGTEMFMTSMQANLENHERYRITEIDRAIEKIENGTYEECTLCNNTIPEERLEALPEANICMECAKEKLPIQDTVETRPSEEDLLYPAFGRTSNINDYTGFDGEDAYQEVAKFNQVKSDPSFSTGDHLGIFDDDSREVQDVENISNEQYIEQLPDGHYDEHV